MAILKGIEFTGSLGELSAYKMKGSDKIILRKKGGPKRNQLMNAKSFERVRDNMNEFSGVGKTVKAIRYALTNVKRLADYNFTCSLTSICKKIQKLDEAGENGRRGIFLSQHRYMLAGFRLNKRHPFVNIVTCPIDCTLNREEKSAVIQLPQLIQGVNLNLPWKFPLYRFSMSLGIVTDVVYEGDRYNDHFAELVDAKLDSPWQVATDPLPAQTLELKLDIPGVISAPQTLVFAIGIEMGAPGLYGQIDEVKYAGSACILAVG